MESRWLAVSNLPETATEDTLKACFERHGRVQSIQIDHQGFAFIAFFDILTASKAHHGENILDRQQLRTTFHNGSNSTPRILLETSPVASPIVEPSPSSPSSILMDNTMAAIHEERDKHIYSPEENTRHQVVPMKHDSDLSKSTRKAPLNPYSKITESQSTRRKYVSSSSSSERSPKHCHQHSSKLQRPFPDLAHLKTKILKISHLPLRMSTQSLRETLRNLFTDFTNSSHLLSIKIIDDYALLIFRKSDDVDKALHYVLNKSLNGLRLKAERYYGSLTETDEYDLMKRSNTAEYSVKATRTLYIGNLTSEISYKELREIYSGYGEIIEIEIKRQQPQHAQIFAFIQYADIKSVVRALKSKATHDHSIKLGFGKSQPTNVLWLDDLPLDITELILRSFLSRVTNLRANEILDIYIDNQIGQKRQAAQALVYFTDTMTAQNVINLLRGKRLDGKRIQVDFASRIFLSRFSDIIQETNEKLNNDRWTNQSYRRYSKVSDPDSSITRHSVRRHSSSSSNHSSINPKSLIKSETEKHTNTERVFDWLMQNPQPTILTTGEAEISEEQLFTSKTVENKTVPKEIYTESKKVFQTKIIPLEADPLFIQSDIRLKIYSSINDQLIRSVRLPYPNFAQTLIKSSNHAMILNPKAYLKHSLNENLAIHKELDERIKRLDQQIQISSSVLSSTKSGTTIKYDPMSTTTTLHPSIPSSYISPSLANDKSNVNSSITFIEHLDSLIKFKPKPIPLPSSVIPTLPISSCLIKSPSFTPSKSLTPPSVLKNQHQPAATTFSSMLKPPTPLKSILKQPCHLSPSIANETRKAVHIISTKPSFELPVKQTLPSEDKKKPIIQPKNTNNRGSIKTKQLKAIDTTKISVKLVKKTTVPTKTTHEGNKTTKISPEIKKKPLVTNETAKPKSQSLLNKPEGKAFNHNNKISTRRPIRPLKKKLKQTSCMYDRIKERPRREKNRNNLSIFKDESTPSKDIQSLKRKNVIDGSCQSADEIAMHEKMSMVYDSKIFDSEGNDGKKILQVPRITFKFNKNEFILKKKRKIKVRGEKHRLTEDQLNQTSKKKIRLESKIQEEQTMKVEVASTEIPNSDDQPIVTVNEKIVQPASPVDCLQNEEIKSIPLPSIDVQQTLNEFSSQCPVDESPEKTLTVIDQPPALNHNVSIKIEKSIPSPPSENTKSSYVSSLATNELANLFDSQSITNHKHLSRSLHLFPQTFTPSHQYFPYPFFPLPPDSPPLSTRPRLTSNCSSVVVNSFPNTVLSEQQYCYDQESRRESLSKFSTTSSQYLGSDSTTSLRSPFELYGYPSKAQQILNSFATELYRTKDIQSYDPYSIQWEGHIILKTDQAYIRTQLVAGNAQIARLSINYWNSDLNDQLRISQRMRLDEIQLDGVTKHMQMDDDYCLLIAEPNGLTPDEIGFEQNHLRNGVIQYLNGKKAAGILNIHLPGALRPVYVLHIFPPCEFASEILQQRAPDAYRCVVQNKADELYLLFIITSTIQ